MPIADNTLILEGQQDFSGGMDSSLSPALIGDNAVATAVNLTFRGGRPRSRPGFRQVELSPGRNSGLDLFNNNFFQGSSFYTERRPFFNSSLIAVCGGIVIKIDAASSVVDAIYPVVLASDMVIGRTYTVRTSGNTVWQNFGAISSQVGTTFTSTGTPGVTSGQGTAYEIQAPLDPFSTCYFTQAEKYMIIQDGKNPPLIYDGDDLYISGVGPTNETGGLSGLHTIGAGTIMAYGQGRLFVANADRTEITAGDLVYAGSTTQKEISTGSGAAGSSTYTFSTSGGVSSVSITSGGAGYTAVPTVTIAPPGTPGGLQATAAATISGGSVNSIFITFPGSGYISPPLVTISPHQTIPGATATGTAIITANHNFNPGDVITISGHSSNLGVNGTWECKTGTTGNTIAIDLFSPSGVTTSGTGGFVTKANAGAQSDLLKFTETTYLSEGGALQLPSFLGKITGMIFLQVQDTSTGQGDMLVFCERGTASFAVSTPRENWKTTQFQRVLFQEIGATGPNALVTSNGDIFFRSFDGIRSYRNARAEQNSYGQVPVSAEMNSILPFDSKSLLPFVSAVVFDNRLIFTATPTVNYSGLARDVSFRQPVTFSKLIVLDFTTISTIGAKRAASYDGMWGGLNVTQLVGGLIQGRPRAFVFAFDFNNNRVNVLWEITENDAYDSPLGVEPQPINSILETRSFTFGSPLEQKKMIRADFWLSDLQGNVDIKVYWRPDQYPCWRPWHTFSRCSSMNTCISNGVTVQNKAFGVTDICFSSQTPNNFTYRIGKGGVFTLPLIYSLDDNPLPQAAAMKTALQNAGFNVAFVTRSGTFPNYCFTISTIDLQFWETYTNPLLDVWELGTDWVAAFPPGSGTIETDILKTYTVVPVRQIGDENCSSNFTVKNLQPQYRPQIRMPTPPEDTDPIISRPYVYGNEFQLRLEFTGHFEMNRILLLGQRILEQYQGTDYIEVL